MLKLVNGRSYYLELCAPPDQQQYLFHLWLQLISLLKPPEDISNTEVNVKSKDFDTCPKKVPSSNDPSEKVGLQQTDIKISSWPIRKYFLCSYSELSLKSYFLSALKELLFDKQFCLSKYLACKLPAEFQGNGSEDARRTTALLNFCVSVNSILLIVWCSAFPHSWRYVLK